MSSTDLIPDLCNKVVIVTGATSGIGLEAARIFARISAKLVLAYIEKDRMAEVAAAFEVDTPDADIVQMHIDVIDLESVHSFSKRPKRLRIPRIDVLLLNAGIGEANDFRRSPQGYELTFATNHLGHWLLTGLLIDFLEKIPDSRIIAVSSIAHTFDKSINYAAATGDDPSQYSRTSTHKQNWQISFL